MHRSVAARRSGGRRQPLFEDDDYWRLWYAGLVLFVVRWLETVAVAMFAYHRTGSAFIVAMLTMLRVLPMGLFGAFLGAAAEQVERRTALILVVLLALLSSGALAVLAAMGRLEVWHLGLASFANGIGWATDNPVRRVMLGDVVGPERMGTAMSIDVGTNNASRMLGPTLGGILYATFGIKGVFTLSVALYLTSLYVACTVRYRNRHAKRPGASILAPMAEGVRLVRRDRRLIGTLVVTLIFNIFGWPFTAMVAVIGQDRLGLNPQGIGLLASMDGVGAFIGAVLMALCARPAFYKPAYVGGVAVYCALMVGFALSTSPLVAASALILAGIGQSGFSIMQATLVYLAAPPEMRSRILGVLSVCIGVGPIGFLHIGWLAGLMGAHWATAVSGAEGLVALALTRRWWRPI